MTAFAGSSVASGYRRSWRRVLVRAMIGVLACLPGPAWAEKTEIAIAKQFSIAFLPLIVMERDRLIEKHAREAGLPEVQVNWLTFSGPDTMISSLLSGSADVAAAGIPGALIAWARTRGSRQAVKGIAAIGAVPLYLVTRDLAIASVRDFKDTDRIATPGGKGTINAVLLQMDVAQTLGEASVSRFDPLLFSMGQPDATTAMLAGVDTVKSVVSTPPFQDQLLAAPGMRRLFSSFAVMGGPHSYANVLATTRFHDENPKLFGAIVAALKEAEATIAADPRGAIAGWIAATGSKLPLDVAARVLDEPGTNWSLTPQNVMKFADFMARAGMISSAPASWRDLYFPEAVADRPGG